MRAVVLAVSVALACPVSAVAHDLGTQGPVYEIAEPSLIQTILKRLAKVNWKQIADGMAKSAVAQQHHYPSDGLTPAVRTRTVYVDPSIVLTRPIEVPDSKGGWKVLYPAGTRANPLKKVRPPTRLLVFDPHHPAQVAFAVAALRADPLHVELMVSGGDLKGMAKLAQRPVFYANPQIVQRFGLTHTPALIGVGRGAHEYDLAVTQFAPADLSPKTAGAWIKRAWNGLQNEKHEQPRARG